ncbi:MAG TPA: cyclase family protein [Ktedonobacteraceae bacterium]|jgi:kynurenine formamidase
MDKEQLFNFFSHARVYDLEQLRYAGAPIHPGHAPGYVYTLYRRHEEGLGEARTSASGFVYTSEHSGTHIDALSHQAEDLYLYGKKKVTARLQTATGFTELGVETITPMLSRGVLLDVARYRGVEWIEADQPITRQDLEDVCQQQKVVLQQGDVVLVRTGSGARWKDPKGYLSSGGVSADASQWLADQQVKAVGADNVAWDMLGVFDPDLHVSLPGHLILLVRHGIYIIENLFLEDLARDQVYEFLFVCLPLKMRGATGSPVRPIAVMLQE